MCAGLPEIQVSTLNFIERSCLPHIASTIQIFHKRKKAHSKQTAFVINKQLNKMEQFANKMEQDINTNKSNKKNKMMMISNNQSFVKGNREYLKIN